MLLLPSLVPSQRTHTHTEREGESRTSTHVFLAGRGLATATVAAASTARFLRGLVSTFLTAAATLGDGNVLASRGARARLLEGGDVCAASMVEREACDPGGGEKEKDDVCVCERTRW